MKKSKMPIVGAIIAGVGIIGLFGIIQSDNKGAMLFGSLILIAVGIIILILGIRKNNKPNAKPQPIQPAIDTKSAAKSQQLQTATENETVISQFQKPPFADGNKGANLLPLTIDGYYKIYEYLETVCVVKDEENPYEYVQEKANANQRVLLFEFEEDNPFDENAVAIMLENKKIGYVYKGMIQKMLHDYANKGYQVCANINTFSPERITYYIGFYKPKDSCKQHEIRIKNKKLSENYNEGEILSVEYDIVEERFFVMDYCGEKICVLPERAEDYARENHDIPVEVGQNSESLIFFK